MNPSYAPVMFELGRFRILFDDLKLKLAFSVVIVNLIRFSMKISEISVGFIF